MKSTKLLFSPSNTFTNFSFLPKRLVFDCFEDIIEEFENPKSELSKSYPAVANKVVEIISLKQKNLNLEKTIEFQQKNINTSQCYGIDMRAEVTALNSFRQDVEKNREKIQQILKTIGILDQIIGFNG